MININRVYGRQAANVMGNNNYYLNPMPSQANASAVSDELYIQRPQQIKSNNQAVAFIKQRWEKCPALILSGIAGMAGLLAVGVKLFYK